MAKMRTYKIPKSKLSTVCEPAVAYRSAAVEAVPYEEWNPNVPFHGTQEEWWEHFHSIEQGNFTSWEEHQKEFEAWKRGFLASYMK